MSPSAREVREYNAQEALVAAFEKSAHGKLLDEYTPEQTITGLRVGPVEILEGQDPKKPVIRDARTKRLLEGSGRYPRANDAAMVGRATGYKNTTEYRQAFEALFPAGGDVNERGSLAWWFDQAWAAAEGSPQYVDCPHPDLCPERNKKHVVAWKKDSSIIFKMIELGVGKAPQTVNINSHEEKIIQALEHRVIDVNIQGLAPVDVAERQRVIQAFGYMIDEPAAIDVGAPSTAE